MNLLISSFRLFSYEGAPFEKITFDYWNLNGSEIDINASFIHPHLSDL